MTYSKCLFYQIKKVVGIALVGFVARKVAISCGCYDLPTYPPEVIFGLLFGFLVIGPIFRKQLGCCED